MTPPRLAGSICLGVAGLLIEPALGHAHPTEPPLSPVAQEEARVLDKPPAAQAPPARKPSLDRSGRAELGRASFYAAKHDHRRMADGRRFGLAGDSAASKSLPLGTTAKVVNLESGKSAVVKVEDRGPCVRDRVMDVSPKVAERLDMLDMEESGVAPALVKPTAVPQPGGVKLGAGAAEASPQQVRHAIRTAEELAQAPRHRRTAGRAGGLVFRGVEVDRLVAAPPFDALDPGLCLFWGGEMATDAPAAECLPMSGDHPDRDSAADLRHSVRTLDGQAIRVRHG